jgi:hypothetical protein
MRGLFLFLFLANSAFAQTQNQQIETRLNKNNLSFNIGTLIVANGVGLKYERTIPRKQLYYTISAGANFFQYSYFGLENHTVLYMGNGFITGIDKKNHFDASFGLGWDNVEKETSYGGIFGSIASGGAYKLLLPVVGVGYRYQVPNEGFIFRAGVGFPELVYLSLGVSF